MKDRVGAVDKATEDIFNRLPKGASNNAFAPQAACLPKPSIDKLGAPAGKGLQKDPEGFPKGSVRTAGGYTIVPEGKSAAWSIYGPGQGAKDKPITRVHGDPHVQESDGTKWDFTKSSSFRLPDGTVIGANTTAEHGKSVTKSLDIVNGQDRVSISDIDKNKPQTSEVTQDGLQFRQQLAARDAFVLGGGGQGEDQVPWARERNGQLEGVITGSHQNVDGKGSYDQKIDKNKQFLVDKSLRADPLANPAAWGERLGQDLRAFGAPQSANQPVAAAQNMFENVLGGKELAQLLQQIRDLCRQLFP